MVKMLSETQRFFKETLEFQEVTTYTNLSRDQINKVLADLKQQVENFNQSSSFQEKLLVNVTWIGPSLKHFDVKDNEPDQLENLIRDRKQAGDASEETCLSRFADDSKHWTGYVVTHLGELVYLYGPAKGIASHADNYTILIDVEPEEAAFNPLVLAEHVVESEWAQTFETHRCLLQEPGQVQKERLLHMHHSHSEYLAFKEHFETEKKNDRNIFYLPDDLRAIGMTG